MTEATGELFIRTIFGGNDTHQFDEAERRISLALRKLRLPYTLEFELVVGGEMMTVTRPTGLRSRSARVWTAQHRATLSLDISSADAAAAATHHQAHELLRSLVYAGAKDLLERVEKKDPDARALNHLAELEFLLEDQADDAPIEVPFAAVLAWPESFPAEAVVQVPTDETLTLQTRALVGVRPPRERWDEVLVDLHGRPLKSIATINDITALHKGQEVDMAELGTVFLDFLRWQQSHT